MIDTVNLIVDLQAITGTIPNGTVVYVKGYYAIEDGGGGIFIFDKNSTFPEDWGIHFNQTSNETVGKWVRKYEGHINAMFFGIVKYPDFFPTSGPWNSERIQNAIICPKTRQTAGLRP